MDALRLLTILLDVALVATAVLALLYRPQIGGQLALGLRLLMIGVLLLSLTHLADTTLKEFSPYIVEHAAFNAVLHRGLNLAGFILIFLGFFRMRKAMEA
jgi:hypothetical protein